MAGRNSPGLELDVTGTISDMLLCVIASRRRPLKHRIVKKCILVPEFIWNNSEEFLLRSFELSLRRAEKL